jgi:hypothetical protein
MREIEFPALAFAGYPGLKFANNMQELQEQLLHIQRFNPTDTYHIAQIRTDVDIEFGTQTEFIPKEVPVVVVKVKEEIL